MNDAPAINDPRLWLNVFPWPSAGGHKHDRGRLYVVSGGASTSGAARMAAKAGLRIGAGLSTMLSSPSAMLVNAAHLDAVMLKAFDGPDDLVLKADKPSSIVIGPGAGVGEVTRMNVLALATTQAALVLDADALTSFKDDVDPLFNVLSERHVLTPHEGEFERLFPGLLKTKSRLDAALEAARKSGAVLLLKGEETVIAHPDGQHILNRHASPFLATAGSGDVLAGLIGGLLAQGMKALDAAAAAVWIHGDAARRFGPGLIAEDLQGLVPAVLSELYASSANR